MVQQGPRRLVDRIQEAADSSVDAVYQLRAALGTLMEALPADTGLVRTPLGIVCAPDNPRCVALTTKGPRCANPVFDVPAWSGGVIAVLHEDPPGFPSQLCRVHRRRPPSRVVSLEWFIVAEAATWGELLYL